MAYLLTTEREQWLTSNRNGYFFIRDRTSEYTAESDHGKVCTLSDLLLKPPLPMVLTVSAFLSLVVDKTASLRSQDHSFLLIYSTPFNSLTRFQYPSDASEQA